MISYRFGTAATDIAIGLTAPFIVWFLFAGAVEHARNLSTQDALFTVVGSMVAVLLLVWDMICIIASTKYPSRQ